MRRYRWSAVALVAVATGAVALNQVASPKPAARPGVYVGLSDQRLPVKLTADEDRETLSLDVSWLARCGLQVGGIGAVSIERTVAARASKINRDGRFSWRGTSVESLHDGDEERRRLRLVGRRGADGTIRGTWRAQRSFYNGQAGIVDRSCTTGNVGFAVRIGGSLRQPPPRTDRAGNRVIALSGTPDSVAAAADGVWVISHTRAPYDPYDVRHSLREIDPTTGRGGARTMLDDGTAEIPFGAGAGAAWVATHRIGQQRNFAELLRVDARTHRASSGAPPRGWDAGIRAVAVGAGAVWLLVNRASAAPDGTVQGVLRVAPRSGRIVRTIALAPDRRIRATSRCQAGNDSADLLAAGAGAVWVVSTANYGCAAAPGRRQRRQDRPGRSTRLRRIDPHTNRVARTIELRHAYVKLAAGAGGVWATTCSTPPLAAGCQRPASLALHRIRLSDGSPAAVTPLPGGPHVTGLAASRDAVWISQADKDWRGGTLRRLDRATGRLSRILTFQGAPSNVSIAETGVWVLDTVARTLIRIAR